MKEHILIGKVQVLKASSAMGSGRTCKQMLLVQLPSPVSVTTICAAP
jgi:hypothetical protein